MLKDLGDLHRINHFGAGLPQGARQSKTDWRQGALKTLNGSGFLRSAYARKRATHLVNLVLLTGVLMLLTGICALSLYQRFPSGLSALSGILGL